MKANQKYFALVMMVLSVMLASMAARAQNEMELSCRAKAKETALEVYQGCMTEARTQKLKTIREDYRSEMTALKAKYDGMLQEMKATPSVVSKNPTQTAVTNASPKASATPVIGTRSGRAEQPVNGIAKSLPAKQFDNGPAQPIQQKTTDLTVVPTPPVDMAGVSAPDMKEVEDQSGF